MVSSREHLLEMERALMDTSEGIVRKRGREGGSTNDGHGGGFRSEKDFAHENSNSEGLNATISLKGDCSDVRHACRGAKLCILPRKPPIESVAKVVAFSTLCRCCNIK